MTYRERALVSAAAETLEEAHEVVGRLTQAGFARNSIKVIRRAEDLYEVSLPVGAANRARAEQVIANRSGALGSLPGTGAAFALGVAAIALGAGIAAALTARRMVPRYLRDGSPEPASSAQEG